MWFALLLACGEKFDNPESYEGDEAGECSDGADNDLDGLFDCNDDGCAGSPDCEEVVERVREAIKSRGGGNGIKTLARMMKSKYSRR